ncbi:hypothetical protein QBC33DRAFT_536664 [Phialemonium atrogriseum]|uniref:Secreted protein n=1 Tax=Phialemonium atrogriseum TaxID=1093897 RepID=A0AAJ0FHZ3_9PEZI|nr:uncharacterized protein QBC33DRAFT_536664 [Phialemonium atrogriseum]KAK1768252.1 hypothetical protein QBC33DRAFT_536664 [Phialemonium atrogriseum]
MSLSWSGCHPFHAFSSFSFSFSFSFFLALAFLLARAASPDEMAVAMSWALPLMPTDAWSTTPPVLTGRVIATASAITFASGVSHR